MNSNKDTFKLIWCVGKGVIYQLECYVVINITNNLKGGKGEDFVCGLTIRLTIEVLSCSGSRNYKIIKIDFILTLHALNTIYINKIRFPFIILA